MEQATKRILTACIIVSAAGITLITALDYEGNARTMDIAEIGSKMAGENAIVCGAVISKSISSSGTAFITLAGNSSKIRLVFFKNEVHETENISRGRSLCARGTIQMYNGSAEIIGRKIV